MGEDLGSFFREWVRGTDVPTYRFAYRSERTPEGLYRVTCRVRQSGVPADFRMYVPLKVEDADGHSQELETLVQGPELQFSLPLLRQPPRRIVFNDMSAVLCAKQDESWD